MAILSMLPAGTILRMDSGREVAVKEYLAEGATAVIYTATFTNQPDGDTVVVKMAKPGQDEMIRQEGWVLEKMNEVYRLAGDLELTTPELYGRGTFTGNSFIVMEFMKAPVLENLLSTGTTFTEVQALSVARKLFVFLDRLHSHPELKLAYPDFKFENLRVEGAAYRLRVLDLGGLKQIDSPEHPYSRTDVLRAGTFIFAMLSGHVINVSAGELTEEAEQDLATEAFLARSSWGMRSFLQHMLCRVPEFRITDAGKAIAEVDALLEWWNAEDVVLLEKATNYITELPNLDDEGRNRNASRARSGLDIYVKRFGHASPSSAILLKQAVEAYDATSFLNKGVVDLQKGLFDSARQSFEKGEAFESRPALFRRWRYLTDVFQQNGQLDLFSWAEDVSQHFESENYAEALNRLNQRADLKSLAPLVADAQIYSLYRRGFTQKQDGKYQEAVETFQSVQKLLIQLPGKDQDAIQKSEGNVERLIRDCIAIKTQLERQERYQELLARIKEELSAGKLPLEEIKRMVSAGKGSPELASDGVKLLRDLIDSHDSFRSRVLANLLYWSIPAQSEELRNLYQLTRLFADTRLAIDNHQYENIISGLEEMKNRIGQDIVVIQYLDAYVQELLKEASLVPFGMDDYLFWEKVHDLIVQAEKTPIPKSADKKVYAGAHRNMREAASGLAKEIQKNRQAQKRALDRLISQIRILLYTPQPGKLNRESLITELNQLFRLPDAQKLFADGRSRLELVDGYLQSAEKIVREESYSEYREELSRFRKELAAQRKIYQIVADVSAEKYPVSGHEFKERWDSLQAGFGVSAEQVSALLLDCLSHVEKNDPGDDEVKSVIQQCISWLDQAGWGGWLRYEEQRTNRLKEAREKLLTVETEYQKGNLDVAIDLMRSVPSEVRAGPEGAGLQLQLLQTQEFLAWARGNEVLFTTPRPDPDALMRLESYSTWRIAPCYYRQYKIDGYLDRLHKDELKQKLGLGSPQEEKKKKASPVPGKFDWRWVAFLGFGSLVVIALIVLIWRGFVGPFLATLTPTSTLTPTATMTPLPTDTPTPMATPVPVQPSSDYFVPDLIAIAETLPIHPIAAWNLPEVKGLDDSNCTNMDAPVLAGTYALYLQNDVATFVPTQPRLQYEVTVQETATILPPVAGLDTVQLSTFNELNTVQPLPVEWIWVGTYVLNEPGTLQVCVRALDPQSALIPEQLQQPLLLTQIDPVQWASLPVLPLASASLTPESTPATFTYQLVDILDNYLLQDPGSIMGSVAVPDTCVFANGPVIPSSDLVLWNGSYSCLPEASFIGRGVLPAGTYAFVYHSLPLDNPASFTVSFTVANGAGGVAILDSKPVLIDGMQEWISLGEISLAEPAQIEIELTSAAVTGLPIPVDAILVYRQIEY